MRIHFLKETCTMSPILGTSEFLHPNLKPTEGEWETGPLREHNVWPLHLGCGGLGSGPTQEIWKVRGGLTSCVGRAATMLGPAYTSSFGDECGKHASFLSTDVGFPVERPCKDSTWGSPLAKGWSWMPRG